MPAREKSSGRPGEVMRSWSTMCSFGFPGTPPKVAPPLRVPQFNSEDGSVDSTCDIKEERGSPSADDGEYERLRLPTELLPAILSLSPNQTPCLGLTFFCENRTCPVCSSLERGRMGYYDSARICPRGHVVNTKVGSNPHHNDKFCGKCARRRSPPASTVRTRSAAATSRTLHGWDRAATSARRSARPAESPSPGPRGLWPPRTNGWRVAKNLDQKEAAALRAALDEIIRDTPEAPTAALKVKGYMKKVGPIAAEGIKELVVAVASSDVAKAFGAS